MQRRRASAPGFSNAAGFLQNAHPIVNTQSTGITLGVAIGVTIEVWSIVGQQDQSRREEGMELPMILGDPSRVEVGLSIREPLRSYVWS
jgi:hypothetical protein